MPAIVVIGAHWGDEGKGKIVDLLAQSADMVVRFSGGDNAGHTVINSLGEFHLHQMPSGVFSPDVVCVIGNGVVLNAETIVKEVELVSKARGDLARLFISDKAHLILPYHPELDGLEERARGDEAIGTTRRGIGPAYADKAARIGIRTGDLLDPEELRSRLGMALDAKRPLLEALGADLFPFEDLLRRCEAYADRLGPYIRPVEAMVNEAVDSGQTVLFEGAQGTLLDLDFGTYPYVTSSPTIAGAVFTGAGLRPQALTQVVGVFKAYTTRVGTGPMPTELHGAIGDRIRQQAMEFGVTTGRPRRVGWFDAVAGRYSVQLNGMSAGALTRLDNLDDFSEIKVCIAYERDGQRLNEFPPHQAALGRVRPVYDTLPGWQEPTSQVRAFGDLPANARAYVQRLEELLGCPMFMISVGPARDETICVKPLA